MDTAVEVRRWVALAATAILAVSVMTISPASAADSPAPLALMTRASTPDAVAPALQAPSTCDEARHAAKKAQQRYRKTNRAHAKAQNRAETLTKKLKKARKTGKKARATKLRKQLTKHRTGRLTKTRKARAKAVKARDRAKKAARELCAATTPDPDGPPAVCVEQTSMPAAECAALVDIKTANANPAKLAEWGRGDPCTWSGVICHGGHVLMLGLGYSLLTAVPATIGNLTELAYLDLRTNQLTTVPDTIGNLTELVYLFLRDNQLRTVPDAVGNLTELTELNLADNRLTAVPTSVGRDLTNLTLLHLDNNELAGDVSSWAKPMSLRDMRLTLTLAGNGCLHANGDTALAAWLDQWVWAGGWRTGCA